MKKVLLLLSLFAFTVNAQGSDKTEDELQQLKRADMVTFSTCMSYVTSYGMLYSSHLKDKREARLFIALGEGAVFGVLGEIFDMKAKTRLEKFNITDVGYMVAGSLIGWGLSEATIVIVEKMEERRQNKKLRL